MKKVFGVIAVAMMLATTTTVSVKADTLTYSGVEVSSGAIDGIDLTGQIATITIEFADGLLAVPGLDGNVFNLGPISSATYEFSGLGVFSVDTPQNNLEFGSPQGFELSFFDEGFDPLGMLSGTTAGDIGLDPIVGESLQDMFTRLGDGMSISFTQSANFQMLNAEIGSLNGGASTITQNLVGAESSFVTLSLNAANVGIVSYDFFDAAQPFTFGGWLHTYDGTVTITGADNANGFPFDTADYTLGSGTLNDGIPGTSEDNTQLFAQTDTGTMPMIVLNLDQAYTINNITLDSFAAGSNSVPGSIESVDITINGMTETFLTSEMTNNDEFIDLTGSGLEFLSTSQVTISNFVDDQSTSGTNELFGISEIRINGDVPPPNDDWFNSTIFIPDPDFNIEATNVNATVQADEQDVEITASTVWWFVDADVDGELTIDTFGSDFDTVLHIYTDFQNGFGNFTLVDFNDQAGGTNQSEVTFMAEAGRCYEIRVGGWTPSGDPPGSQGEIMLNGTFTPMKGCDFALGDVNQDGMVNLLDVDPFIDAIGGPYICEADTNEDGVVNLLDVSSFVALLGG